MSGELTISKSLDKQVQANKSLEKLALRVYRKGGSSRTAEGYVQDVIVFSRWLGMEPDQVLRSKFDWAAMINEYLDVMIVKDKLARSSAATRVFGIKKWLEVNDASLDWKKVEMPKVFRRERDQIPTREQLRAILNSTSLPEKVLVLIAVSSGLRLSSILALRLKDIDMKAEVPAIRPNPETTKNRRSFVTFITGEARGVISSSLRERQSRGEAITPESFVVASERPRGSRMSKQAAERRWLHALGRVELARKNEGGKWHTFHFHTLRKFYRSWASLSGVNSDVLEFTMGHRGGIEQTYFVPDADSIPEEVLTLLKREYVKALPALEILTESEKVRALEEKVEQQARDLAEKAASVEKESLEVQESKALIEKLLRRVGELEGLPQIQEALRKHRTKRDKALTATSGPVTA